MLPAVVGGGAGGSLAFTGVVAGELWLIGLAAVLAGLLLVVLSRRAWRPRIQTED